MIDYAFIGARLKEARIRKNMTQEQLAAMTDVGSTHISHSCRYWLSCATSFLIVLISTALAIMFIPFVGTITEIQLSDHGKNSVIVIPRCRPWLRGNGVTTHEDLALRNMQGYICAFCADDGKIS